MAAAAGAAIPLIEGLFTATAATAGTAAAAGTAAEAGGLAAAGLTVSGAAAGAGVGTAAAVGGGVAAGAGTAAALSGGATTQAAPQSSSVMRTVAEASTVAATASSLYMLAAGPGRVQIPPSPMTGQGQIDQQTQQAEQDELRRRATAGGLQSTIGTGTGQAGAVLNPATMSNRAVLGG